MSDTWPDPARPGVPLNPERDGAHEITDTGTHPTHKGPWVVLWSAIDRHWCDKWGNIEVAECIAHHRYLGPCLTPAEVIEKCMAVREIALREAEERVAAAAILALIPEKQP